MEPEILFVAKVKLLALLQGEILIIFFIKLVLDVVLLVILLQNLLFH